MSRDDDIGNAINSMNQRLLKVEGSVLALTFVLALVRRHVPDFDLTASADEVIGILETELARDDLSGSTRTYFEAAVMSARNLCDNPPDPGFVPHVIDGGRTD